MNKYARHIKRETRILSKSEILNYKLGFVCEIYAAGLHFNFVNRTGWRFILCFILGCTLNVYFETVHKSSDRDWIWRRFDQNVYEQKLYSMYINSWAYKRHNILKHSFDIYSFFYFIIFTFIVRSCITHATVT